MEILVKLMDSSNLTKLMVNLIRLMEILVKLMDSSNLIQVGKKDFPMEDMVIIGTQIVLKNQLMDSSNPMVGKEDFPMEDMPIIGTQIVMKNKPSTKMPNKVQRRSFFQGRIFPRATAGQKLTTKEISMRNLMLTLIENLKRKAKTRRKRKKIM
uniref:Uncharacterized protein n=1 Tax=Cacopsylla melanoneura TaxID=428564 RepID=A0A8D9E0C4_9HEMI